MGTGRTSGERSQSLITKELRNARRHVEMDNRDSRGIEVARESDTSLDEEKIYCRDRISRSYPLPTPPQDQASELQNKQLNILETELVFFFFFSQRVDIFIFRFFVNVQ